MTGVGVAVVSVAAATDEGTDRILAGRSCRTAPRGRLSRALRAHSALIHVWKNTPGAIHSIKPLLYRHPATHTAPRFSHSRQSSQLGERAVKLKCILNVFREKYVLRTYPQQSDSFLCATPQQQLW